jgi:hypothetical protein
MPKPENIDPHKFPKGQSGNPAGRPKGSRNRATIVREWLEVQQEITNPITGQKEKLQQQDIITLALIKEAREGNVRAWEALMDSAYGKIKDNPTTTDEKDRASVTLPDGTTITK